MLLAAATSKMQMVHKGNCKALELAMNRKLVSVFTVMQLKSHYSFSCKMLLRSYIRFKLHSWRCLDNSKTLQKRHIQWHSLEERGISVLCHRLNWRPKSRIQTFFCTSGLGKPHPRGMKNSTPWCCGPSGGGSPPKAIREKRLFLLYLCQQLEQYCLQVDLVDFLQIGRERHPTHPK